MLVYNYHPGSKVYLGSNIAEESPLEPGVFGLPAHATFTPPPPIPDGCEAIWNNSSWDVQLIQLQKGEEKAPPPIDPWEKLRNYRNEKLFLTDYMFLPDYPPMEPEREKAWRAYRQALRDLPASTADPANPIWPEPPN